MGLGRLHFACRKENLVQKVFSLTFRLFHQVLKLDFLLTSPVTMVTNREH